MIARAQTLAAVSGTAIVSYLVPLSVLTGGALVLGRLTLEPASLRYALVIALLLVVVGVGVTAPSATLYALVIWLAVLGLTRRLVSGFSPPGGADPLLLLGPLTLLVLLAVAASKGAFRRRTGLSNAVLILSGLALIGALNPLQGSVLSGAAGLLFFLVPMLAFWIGRGLCDDGTMTNVLKLVAGFGLLAALYGLSQTFRGFPTWDQAWIEQAQRAGYASLLVHAEGFKSTVRPFGTFSSASEYVVYLGIALVAWLGFRSRKGRLVTAVCAGVIGAAVLLGSSRSVIVSVLVALALMAGLSHRLPPRSNLALAATLLLVLPLVAARATPALTSGQSDALLAHQVGGLAHPLDSRTSTAGFHLTLVVDGLRSAITEPLGHGTGSVSIAGSRYGRELRNTESDPSNVSVALGIIGLAVYLVIFFSGFRRTYLLALTRGDALSRVGFGLLVVTLFQWLAGGNYAVAFLPWLVLGWVDRPRSDLSSGYPSA